jgi:hypothetical protein
MKKILFAVAAIGFGFAFAATNAHAQTTRVTVEQAMERHTEIGAAVGWPTTVSGKYWFDRTFAVQASFGYQFFAPAWWGGTVDGLVHSPSIIDPNTIGARLPLYVGLGARLINYTSGPNATRFGPRVPIGIEAQMLTAPISVFAELAPGLQFSGGTTDGTLDASVGGRVVF